MFAPSATPHAICRLVRSGRVAVCDDDLGVSRTPVSALAQDPRGYLWIGTEDGPVLFDGLAWSAPSGLAPLRGYDVRAFATTPDDRMWVSADGAGLACVDLSTLPYRVAARFGTAEGLPSGRVHCLWGERDGRVWAGTHAGLALIAEGRVERVVTEADGLPSPTVWALAGVPQGQVWVATKAGLAVLAGGIIRPDLIAEGAVRTTGVHAVWCGPSGQVWVGLVGGAILRADAAGSGPWSFHMVHAGTARVRIFRPAGQGRVWVGTTAGVILLEGDTVCDTWTAASGLPAKEVRAIQGDREGRTWAGTMTGLALLEDRAAPVRTPRGPATLVFACAEDREGRMWLGTDAGLAAIDPATDRPVAMPPLPPALAHETVYALWTDGHGRLWVGTERDGLYAIDPRDSTVHAHIDLAKCVPVLWPAEVDGCQLWAGMTGCGLVCVDVETGAVLRRIGAREGLPEENVQALRTDTRGRLWAGTWSGWLACIDPVRGAVLATLQVGSGQDIPPIITDMDRDPAGALWVTTHGGGLVHVDPDADGGRGAIVRALTTQDDLPTNMLYACRADAHGHLWLGTRRGVARYTPATGRCIVAGRSLGLPSEECNSHALHLDAHGDLWVGTVQGVGVVETAKIPEDVPSCAVHITGFAVMGRERAIAPDGDLEIADSDYDLAFSYGAVTFTAAPQVVYRTRLAGLEGTWSAPTVLRSARYTNLRPGAYTFRVAARNWGGAWGTAAEVPFRVVRDRATRVLEEALERARIDKEVALATTAVYERLALQDGLTGLLNRRALDDRLAQEVERARRHGHALTLALADIDHFKEINDTFSHLVGDEVLRTVAHLCQTSARRGDSVGRYGGEEFVLVLPETTTQAGRAVCERLRRAIASHDWDRVAHGLRVTMSIGFAGWRDAAHPPALLAAADAQLYKAKQGGRNRTCGGIRPVRRHHG